MKKILQTLTLFSLFAAWISVSSAQTNGNLTGKITVRAGDSVPNATVIVTNISSGASQRVLTAPDGTFTIVSLPPGTYRVEVESAGFKRASQQNVELVAGSPAEINIVLESGDTASTVEAQATTRTIQDDNGQIAKSLGTNTINDLLVLDRNYQAYMDLFPGVTTPFASGSITEAPQRNRVWHTNGQPNWGNLRLMDGAKNHEPATGQTIHVMPMQALKQMNVVNSGYEAQYGRVSGSFVNTQTSPGTNDFHGELFYLYSNDQWNARNFFNPGPVDKARYRSNQFGGSVGGHIVRDRVFFFGAYEGDYLRDGQTRIATVPTADFRMGNFSAVPDFTIVNPNTGTAAGANRIPFAGNMIPAGMINPAAQALANALPLPNQPGLINNYVANTVERSDGHRATGRLDFYLNDQTNLYVRHGYSNFLTFAPSVFNSEELGGGMNGRLRNHNAAASVAHRFSPKLSLDGLFSFSRYNNRNWGSGIADASAFGLASDVTANGQLPNVSIWGMPQLGNNALFPSRDVTNSYNAALNGGWSSGRHNVKFGFDIWHSRMNGFEQHMFGRNSGFTFGPGATLNMGQGIGDLGGFPNAFASFLLGSPTQVSGFTQGVAPHFRTTEYAGYVADTFRVTERLSLNFGLRYSAFSPVETRENASFFNFGTSQFTPFETGETDLSGTQPWDTNNFAPRFGFAYRVGERTVLRGAWALTYFRPNLTWFAQSFLPEGFNLFDRGVATGFQTVTGNFARLPLVPSNGGDGLPSGTVAILKDDIETPYLQSYNFQIQHDFGSGASADIAYVGNMGRHLPYTQNLNAAAPGAALPIADRTAPLYELGTGLTSNYNALQATFNKRFTNWVSFAGQYTWSKALDYGNGLMPFLNNLDRSQNYGPADWDRTHMFTLSHVWEPLGANFRADGWKGALLGGWKLNGILRAVTGTPVTLTADPLLCACPGNTARANVVGTGTVTRIIPEPTIFGYFVGVPYRFPVFEFQQPDAGSFGNLGRNSIYGDGFWNYDLSVIKGFQVTEQNRLEVRGDVFNLTNTPHFATPVVDVNNVNFGRSLSTMPGFGARTIRLGAKYIF
jgi:hypothetical protein